jgi:hypothetical protein
LARSRYTKITLLILVVVIPIETKTIEYPVSATRGINSILSPGRDGGVSCFSWLSGLSELSDKEAPTIKARKNGNICKRQNIHMEKKLRNPPR